MRARMYMLEVALLTLVAVAGKTSPATGQDPVASQNQEIRPNDVLEPHVRIASLPVDSQTHGRISLYRTHRSLSLYLIKSGAVLDRIIRFPVQEPADFQPLNFTQASSSLIVLSGYSVETGDGMIVGVHYSVERAKITQIEVIYSGASFSRAESLCPVPGRPTTLYLLDTQQDEVRTVDVRSGTVSAPLFGASEFPRIVNSSRIRAYPKITQSGQRVNVVTLFERSTGPWPNTQTLGYEDPGFAYPKSIVTLYDLDLDLVPDLGG